MKILSHSRRCRPAGIGLVGEEVFPSIRNPDHEYQTSCDKIRGRDVAPLEVLLDGWEGICNPLPEIQPNGLLKKMKKNSI